MRRLLTIVFLVFWTCPAGVFFSGCYRNIAETEPESRRGPGEGEFERPPADDDPQLDDDEEPGTEDDPDPGAGNPGPPPGGTGPVPAP